MNEEEFRNYIVSQLVNCHHCGSPMSFSHFDRDMLGLGDVCAIFTCTNGNSCPGKPGKKKAVLKSGLMGNTVDWKNIR